jgi:hypothetical protein
MPSTISHSNVLSLHQEFLVIGRFWRNLYREWGERKDKAKPLVFEVDLWSVHIIHFSKLGNMSCLLRSIPSDSLFPEHYCQSYTSYLSHHSLIHESEIEPHKNILVSIRHFPANSAWSKGGPVT